MVAWSWGKTETRYNLEVVLTGITEELVWEVKEREEKKTFRFLGYCPLRGSIGKERILR